MSVVGRAMLAAAVVWVQAACTSQAGDYVSYALWNRDTEHEVQDCVVRGVDPPEFILSCAGIHPLPKGAPGWSFGGAASMPGSKHRIPSRVTVGWRLPPRSGQELYRGDPVGPFEVDIDGRIPADVRAKVRGSSRYQLEIALGIGVEPVTLRWRLLEWTEGMKSHAEVQRGGDW